MSGVPHPTVPGWVGESASVMRTDPPFVTWTATDAGAPFAITHERKVTAEAGVVESDIAWIGYRFGDPSAPVRASHILGSREAAVVLPGSAPAPDQAAIPTPVLGWLQQRFARVTVLTTQGYVAVWTDAAA